MVQTRSDSKVRTVASSHLPMRHVRRLNEGRRRDGLSGLGSAPGSRKSIHVKRTSSFISDRRLVTTWPVTRWIRFDQGLSSI